MKYHLLGQHTITESMQKGLKNEVNKKGNSPKKRARRKHSKRVNVRNCNALKRNRDTMDMSDFPDSRMDYKRNHNVKEYASNQHDLYMSNPPNKKQKNTKTTSTNIYSS